MARQPVDDYADLRSTAPGQDVVRLWAAHKYKSIVDAAFGMMRSPPGTEFIVEPLCFVGFPTERARTAYYIDLLDEMKRTTKGKMTPQRIATFHTARVQTWLCKELQRHIASLAQVTAPMTYHVHVDKLTGQA